MTVATQTLTGEAQGSTGRKNRAELANVAFKTAFQPLEAGQFSLLEQAFGTARFAYNWALTAWEERRARGEKNSFELLRNALNDVKREQFPWMLNVPKDVCAEAIRNLTVAFKNFFEGQKKKTGGAKYPRRKKKGKAKFAFRLPADRLRYRDVQIKDGSWLTEVYLSTIGWVRLCEQFMPVGKIVDVTVSRQGKQYFASFCMEYVPVKRIRKVLKPRSVGIDLGLIHTLTLGSGVKIEGPRSHKSHLKTLARANRRLHKCVKGSRNRRKAARKLAKSHRRVANIRTDFTEKVTTQLLRHYDIIGIEDLNIAGMQKAGLFSRSLTDASLGGITSALYRKSKKYGCLVVAVDRFFPSSKQCRKCGVKNHDLDLAERIFRCIAEGCLHCENRDVHAAKNIHKEALEGIPRATGDFMPVEYWSLPSRPQGQKGKPVRRSRKRQPLGAVTSNAEQRQNSSRVGQYDQL